MDCNVAVSDSPVALLLVNVLLAAAVAAAVAVVAVVAVDVAVEVVEPFVSLGADQHSDLPEQSPWRKAEG